MAEPKRKVLDHVYGDIAADVTRLLAERIQVAVDRGVALEQLVLDPGPDLGKSPAQTIALLRGLGADPDVRNVFSGVRVSYQIDADATADEIKALVAQSQKHSAVFDILTNPTDVTVDVT